MNYAELTARLQGEGFSPDFILRLLKELGYSNPMGREYSESNFRDIHREAIICQHEARKGTKRSKEPEVRIVPGLAQAGLWFRATPYRVKGGFIEPAPKAKVEEYSLDGDALNCIVADLAKLGKEVCFTAPSQKTPLKDMRLGPECEETFLLFYNTYGPLGVSFRDVWAIEVWPLEGRVTVKRHPTAPWREEFKKYFGAYGAYRAHEYNKFARWRSRKIEGGKEIRWFEFDHQAFHRYYREDGVIAAVDAVNFSLCARQITLGEPEILLEGRLKTLAEAFLHSRPKISYVGGRAKLELAWEPNSLIDAAYLHLFKATLEGGYRICKDPKCGRLFRPAQGRGKPREYCSDRCMERHVKERQRARQGKT